MSRKRLNISYWIFTGLFAGFMIFSAIPDLMVTSQAVDIVSTQLGYPKYIISFLGVAKLLGAIAILVPGYPRLKEWAYAGLVFDLIGGNIFKYSNRSACKRLGLYDLTVFACGIILYFLS